MNIDSIRNGYVIDHIKAGKAMEIYDRLELSKLDVPVAMIMGASSKRTGKKDIIKIDGEIEINMDVIGYVDPGATVNTIKNCELIDKRKIEEPEFLVDVLRCKNPRCITSTEQEIKHKFRLTDPNKHEYRCVYCDTKG
ncbi:MAG: aspartate carbamoyltransferase regulatory subunit [Lachnospiraceae bacterium]|nr:aspartate carbamoyltransferase regulatory subunit [Lachnospiraceae bacterium]